MRGLTSETNTWRRSLLVVAYLLLKVERRERARHRLRPFWIEDINIGSARTLTGNVLIGHVFLDNVGRAWDEDRIGEVREKVCAATSWLEQQAATYNVRVSIENRFLDDINISFDGSIPTHENRSEHRLVVKRRLLEQSINRFSP